MRLFDIVQGVWAITPEMHNTILNIYDHHLRKSKIDKKEIEAQIGRPLKNTKKEIEKIGNVAIIGVNGVISKRMNLFAEISGGVSTEILGQQIIEAVEDKDISTIVLDMDTPGGSIQGIQELVGIIEENRKKKTIISFSDGLIASAGAWIASATSITILSGTDGIPFQGVGIGSIGTRRSLLDVSEANKKAGIKINEIFKGEFKITGSENKPLSETERAIFQQKVDDAFNAFVSDLKKFRNIDTKIANGLVFEGEEAINSGLVDGVSTFDNLIDILSNKDQEGFNKILIHGDKMGGETISIKRQTLGENMNLEELELKHPDLYKEVYKSGFEEAKALGEKVEEEEEEKKEKEIKGAIEGERKRCLDILALVDNNQAKKKICLSGLESGATASDIALNILKSEEVREEEVKISLRKDFGETIDPISTGQEPENIDVSNMGLSEKIKHYWDKNHKNCTHEFSSIEAYEAYARRNKVD